MSLIVVLVFGCGVLAGGAVARLRLNALRRQLLRAQLVASVQDALEMAETGDGALTVVGVALERLMGDAPVELLLSDSSGAHLRRAVASSVATDHQGCAVPAPWDCPAVRRGQTLEFARSDALDACPHLRACAAEPGKAATISAVCVPVTIGGSASGVIHTFAPATRRPTPDDVHALEHLARQAGARLGVLRAMATSELHASTDPLTGLMNRRSLLAHVERIASSERVYAVAIADLDRFKALNDRFGHDVGDQALRVFAQALRDGVRGVDVACRYGGEEFVIVFPGCTQAHAEMALQRVRAMFRAGVAAASLPRGTASFGVADSSMAAGFEAVLKLADQALLRAKAEGRDRIASSERPGRELEVIR